MCVKLVLMNLTLIANAFLKAITLYIHILTILIMDNMIGFVVYSAVWLIYVATTYVRMILCF